MLTSFRSFILRSTHSADKKFTYWAEKCNAPEFFNSSYRNMWERLADATSPRVQHAHSFDLDSFVRHQRDITDKDRRQISDYYNSLNPSVYPDHKHHFTLARILTTYHSNFSGVEMRMVGLFKPESKYYEKDQRVEDYIYIDVRHQLRRYIYTNLTNKMFALLPAPHGTHTADSAASSHQVAHLVLLSLLISLLKFMCRS